MKKYCIVALFTALLVLVPAASFAITLGIPVEAPGGSTVVAVKKDDFVALLNRKSYRLGVRGGILSPSDTITVTKDTPFSFGFDFDAKLNENLDMGPRFTYLSKKFVNAASVNATYGVLMFGFGARVYVTYFGDYGSTHGFFNIYFAADGNYCVASKSSEILATSPASFSGFMGNAGAGVEMAFGPNTTGFVDARYQKSSVNDSAGNQFPLDGYVVNAGARVAFF